MSKYTVKVFGSGWAVYKGDERLTCALDESVAEDKKLYMQMNDMGFTEVYNPFKKTVKQLLKFFRQYNPKIKVVRVTFSNRVIDFTGL